MYKDCVTLVHLVIVTSATPTSAFALLLDVDDDIHAAVFEELVGALADVFDIGGRRSDDVNHAEDAPWFVGMGMFVVVIVVVMVVGV